MSPTTRAGANTVQQFLERLRLSLNIECERFAAFLEIRPGFFLTCFSLIYFIGALISASERPFWLDEIIALHISGLPRLKDIWASLLNATDGNPPLYYLVLRPVLDALGTGPVATRLPSIVGVWLAAFCTFTFVRRHASVLAAALATLCFVHTGASYWSGEARPYAMVLALSGVALVSWQRCAEGYSRRIGWLLALALSMAGLVSTHYYAALMTVPLFCGELVRLYMRKRFDWAVAACLAAGVSFILPWLPLLRSVRANVAENAATTNYFAAPDIGTLYNAYGALLSPLVVPGVVCLALVVALAGISGKNEGPEARRGVPAHEAAAALALAFFPLIAFLTAVLVTKTFVLRYVLEGAMGLSIVLGFLFHYSLARRPTLGVCILALLYSYFNYMALSAIPVSGRPYGADLSFLEERAGNSPVVVAEGLIFAPMWYYAPAGLQQRLFYVTDLDYARRTTDTTNENIMLKLKPMAPRSIVPLQQFVAAHNSFFVYYRGGSANSSVDELLSRKCGVALEAKRGIQLLFRCNCR